MMPPRTSSSLAMFIGKDLQTREFSRVYSDILSGCWPQAKDSDTLTGNITAFALQNGWAAEFRDFGKMGVAAEFRKLVR